MRRFFFLTNSGFYFKPAADNRRKEGTRRGNYGGYRGNYGG